jgi:hypothetical protein
MHFGGFWMKPNFDEMSTAVLKKYVLSHRDDDEAIRVLFSRRNPPDSEATWYGLMCTPEGVPIEENIRIAEEAILQRAKRDREAQIAKNRKKKSYRKKDNWRQGSGRKLSNKWRQDSGGRLSKNRLILGKSL